MFQMKLKGKKMNYIENSCRPLKDVHDSSSFKSHGILMRLKKKMVIARSKISFPIFSTNADQCGLMWINVNQCESIWSKIEWCRVMPINVNQRAASWVVPNALSSVQKIFSIIFLSERAQKPFRCEKGLTCH